MRYPFLLRMLLALLAALSLLVTACGSDGDTTGTAQAVSTHNKNASQKNAERQAHKDEVKGQPDNPEDHHQVEETTDYEPNPKGNHTNHDSHNHSPMEVTYEPVPTIALATHLDPMSGVNVEIITTGFTLAPERASTAAVDGEGHFHLYVDGVKHRRLYSHWAHVDLTDPGDYEIMVELSANNHSPLTHNGQKLEATSVITIPDANHKDVAEDHSHDHDHDHMHNDDETSSSTADTENADTTIQLQLEDGKPTNGIQRHRIQANDTIEVTVTADTTDELHIHGYDIVIPFSPNTAGVAMFEANIPGTFEVETHSQNNLVMELEVR